jgi:hypothetical protein
VLLRVQGVKLPPWRVGALLMLGIFFNMFMPGGTGGDVLKIYYLLKEVPEKKGKVGGLLAVLMDRLIGLMALIMISSIIIGIQYNWLRTASESRHLTWVLLMILVGSLGGIVFLIRDQRLWPGAQAAEEDADAGRADRSGGGVQRIRAGVARFPGGAGELLRSAFFVLLPVCAARRAR